MVQAGIAAHQGRVQLQDIHPEVVVAHHPSNLPAREEEGLGYTATPGTVRDTRTGQEALAAAAHRAPELARRTGWEEAECGRSTAGPAGTDAGSHQRLLQLGDDRTGRNRTSHMVELPEAAQAPGLHTGPVAGRHDLPWRQGLASAPETTESPRPFHDRLHRGRSSKRTNRLHRGCARLSDHGG